MSLLRAVLQVSRIVVDLYIARFWHLACLRHLLDEMAGKVDVLNFSRATKNSSAQMKRGYEWGVWSVGNHKKDVARFGRKGEKRL